MHAQRIFPLFAIALIVRSSSAQDAVAADIARGDSAYAATAPVRAPEPSPEVKGTSGRRAPSVTAAHPG